MSAAADDPVTGAPPDSAGADAEDSALSMVTLPDRALEQGAVDSTGAMLKGMAAIAAGRRQMLFPWWDRYQHFDDFSPDQKQAVIDDIHRAAIPPPRQSFVGGMLGTEPPNSPAAQRPYLPESLGNWLIDQLHLPREQKAKSFDEFAGPPPEKSALYRAGEATQRFAAPFVAPAEYQQHPWLGGIPRALGSFAPVIGATIGTTVLGAPEAALPLSATLGGLGSAGDQSDQALAKERQSPPQDLAQQIAAEAARTKAASDTFAGDTLLGALPLGPVLRPVEGAGSRLWSWARAKVLDLASRAGLERHAGELGLPPDPAATDHELRDQVVGTIERQTPLPEANAQRQRIENATDDLVRQQGLPWSGDSDGGGGAPAEPTAAAPSVPEAEKDQPPEGDDEKKDDTRRRSWGIPDWVRPFLSKGFERPLEVGDAQRLPPEHRGLIFVYETPTGPQHARDFQAGTPGSYVDEESGRFIVPAVRYQNPKDGGVHYIKLDGYDLTPSNDGRTMTLIDRKAGWVDFSGAHGNALDALERTKAALEQNPNFKIVYEFKNAADAARAQQFIEGHGYRNVVQVRTAR